MSDWLFSKRKHPSCHFADGWEVAATIQSVSGDSHDFVVALLATEELADAILRHQTKVDPGPTGFIAGTYYWAGMPAEEIPAVPPEVENLQYQPPTPESEGFGVDEVPF